LTGFEVSSPGELFVFERQVKYRMMEAESKENIEKKIRKLRKDFQKNVQPVLRRHNYYLSKGERRRIKKKKAIKRIQRRERRMLRTA
jgi:ribosomal protein S21